MDYPPVGYRQAIFRLFQNFPSHWFLHMVSAAVILSSTTYFPQAHFGWMSTQVRQRAFYWSLNAFGIWKRLDEIPGA